MLYALILSLIFVLIFNKVIFGKFFSLLNFFQFLWHFVAILSLFGFYDTFVPSFKTYGYILLFLYCIELGCLIFTRNGKKSVVKNDKDILLNQNLSWKFIQWVLILCNIILFVFVIKSFPYLLQGVSTLRDAYLNYEINSNKTQMLLSIVVFSLGHAAGMYSLIDFLYNKKFRLSLCLYIAFLIEIVLMTGGRGHILLPIGIACLALLNKYRLNFKEMIQDNKVIFLMVLIVFIVVLIISSQRRLQNQGLVYNIYAYFVGPIHLLGVYIDNPGSSLLVSNHLLFGQILISGFSYPFTFLLRLFAFDIKAGLYTAYEVTQVFTPISPTMYINNNCTALYYFLRDFGVIGLVIIPLLLSYVLIYLSNKAQREPTLKNKIFNNYFCYQFLFLLFSFKFAEPSVIFCFIFIFIIEKISLYFGSKDVFVSVIMSTRDTPCEYLISAIKSILNQTHKNFEFIIVLDGGSDGEIISQKFCDTRIKILENKTSRGLPYSLNRAIKYARGKYIFRMDSDDIASQKRLEKQIIYMENHPNVVACGMYAKKIGQETGFILNVVNNHSELKCGLLYNATLIHPTVCMRHAIIKDNRVFYKEHYQYSQDYDMWIRLSQFGDIAIVPALGLKYRVHSHQISTAKKEQQVAFCQEIMIKNSLDKFSINKEEVLENLMILNGINPLTEKNMKKLANFIEQLKKDKKLMCVDYDYSDIKKTFDYRLLTLSVKNGLIKKALKDKLLRKHLVTFSNIYFIAKRQITQIFCFRSLKKEFEK